MSECYITIGNEYGNEHSASSIEGLFLELDLSEKVRWPPLCQVILAAKL